MNAKKELNWIGISYLAGIPLGALLFLPLALHLHVFFVAVFIYAFLHYCVDCLSITFGYHRLVSHKSFEANPLVKWIVLVTGAGSFQNSALVWSVDHRKHHREVDTENDPYSINKGFFYAHFLWMFYKDPATLDDKIPADLRKDEAIQWQHRHYLALAIAMGWGLPVLIGLVTGIITGHVWADTFAFFYVGVLLRLLVSGHCTFAINSIAHTLGTRPYSKTCSARDNWFLSLLTFGEGYHNFHHKFQADYRNGIVWYSWDPTKWSIFLLSKLGLTSHLNRIAAERIRLARMEATEEILVKKGFNIVELVKRRYEAEAVFEKLQALRSELRRMKEAGTQRWNESERHVYLSTKRSFRELKRRGREAVKEWKIQKRIIQSIPRVATV